AALLAALLAAVPTVDTHHPAAGVAPDPQDLGEVEPLEHDLVALPHRR
ncbi:MAG: hypothetical protein INR63_11360, partial [Actinomycetospora chiangmaiensis]|nr:hypothetical protein [Actinomycetospora chiangmaiensis]